MKNPIFPGMYMQYVREYDVTNISDTRPRKNNITMGKVDTNLDKSQVWHHSVIFFLNPLLSFVFFIARGKKFQSFEPEYLKDINPYVYVWNLGWLRRRLSLKL